MSRILWFEELEAGLPTRELLSALATAIMNLQKARAGNLVVFGSVVWGAHNWRSDIDVAVINPAYIPPLDSSDICTPSEVEQFGASEVFQMLRAARTLPDAISSIFAAQRIFQVLNFIDDDEIVTDLPVVEGAGFSPPYNAPKVDPRLSPSLRDHFKVLARHHGGPWSEFFDKLPYRRGRTRTHDIRGYVDNVRERYLDYEQFLVFQREGGLIADLIGNDELHPAMRALQSAESMPRQLMRKILGQKKAMVSPDTPERILERFRLLPDPWVADAVTLFDRFHSVTKQYVELAETVVANPSTSHRADYWREVCKIYQRLPVNDLADLIKKAYPCHCATCEPRT
jgi:hypothetical protein